MLDLILIHKGTPATRLNAVIPDSRYWCWRTECCNACSDSVSSTAIVAFLAESMENQFPPHTLKVLSPGPFYLAMSISRLIHSLLSLSL